MSTQTKHIFCLTSPGVVAEPVMRDGKPSYRALETHTIASLSARIGVPQTTCFRWLKDGTLPATRNCAGRHKIASNILEELALRVRFEKQKKISRIQDETRLSAVLNNPELATDEGLIDAYYRSKDPHTAGQIWQEVSKRYHRHPYAINQAISATINRNRSEVARAPKVVNQWDKSLGRTVQVRKA
jgi:hypothetical protein